MSYMSLALQPGAAAVSSPIQQNRPEGHAASGSPGPTSGALSTVLQVLLLLTTLSGVSLVLCAVAAGAFGWTATS